MEAREGGVEAALEGRHELDARVLRHLYTPCRRFIDICALGEKKNTQTTSKAFSLATFFFAFTLMASMVPARSVAMGFSQKTCLPACAKGRKGRMCKKRISHTVIRHEIRYTKLIHPQVIQPHGLACMHGPTCLGALLDLVGVELGRGADPDGLHLRVVDHLVAVERVVGHAVLRRHLRLFRSVQFTWGHGCGNLSDQINRRLFQIQTHTEESPSQTPCQQHRNTVHAPP